MFDVSELFDEFDQVLEKNHHDSFSIVFSKRKMLAILDEIVDKSTIVKLTCQ